MVRKNHCLPVPGNLRFLATFVAKSISVENYGTSVNQNEIKGKELEARRKEIMARGLPKQKPIKGVKQILLVASGKGGVGKSTVSVNLSVALKMLQPEKSVGLLDADVFGPSIPLMMNIREEPTVDENNLMVPPTNYGIKCMSMGFLIEDKSPVIWRGLMVMNALHKLLWQVAWDPLDYLIVDTPPGTGDTHLSLIQNLLISGALLVTTPQTAALSVTRKGARMFEKLGVPIAGIVENMSTTTCPKCSHQLALFGKGCTSLADELGIKVLQSIPLHEEITEGCDYGKPVVLSAPGSHPAQIYKVLAENIADFLEQQAINKR